MAFALPRLSTHRATFIVVLAASVAAQNTAAPSAVFAVAVALWLAYVKLKEIATRAPVQDTPEAKRVEDRRLVRSQDTQREVVKAQRRSM